MKKTKKLNDRSFWSKMKKNATVAGRKLTESALTMYYCMKDKDTPLKAKAVIVGALAYFVLPTDAISDFLPVVGFTDDLTVIVTSFKLILKHVKDSHIQKAKEQANAFLKPVAV